MLYTQRGWNEFHPLFFWLYADTRRNTESGCYGGQYRNDDVQDFSPDWFVFHSFLGFELWLSVGADRRVCPNTSTLMVCCCYQCGGWRLMLSGQANPAPTSNPHRLRLNMPLWLLTHPFVSTHNSYAIKQKNSKTENSFFESTNKGKNTPYKIL